LKKEILPLFELEGFFFKLKLQKFKVFLPFKNFRAGGVAQVLACPPSKHKALSSNPSTTKKRNLKK
jgi:hypothetical protein